MGYDARVNSKRMQQLMTVCSVVLIVVGLLGAVFAQDTWERHGQLLAIAIGLVGLLMSRLLMPWLQRRASRPDM